MTNYVVEKKETGKPYWTTVASFAKVSGSGQLSSWFLLCVSVIIGIGPELLRAVLHIFVLLEIGLAPNIFERGIVGGV